MGEIAAATDRGLRHWRNEDAVLGVALSDALALLAVADGVGGEHAGDVASRGVIEMLASAFAIGTPVDPIRDLREAITDASRTLWLRSLGETRLRGMGSTVVAAVIVEDQAWLANVGDSRAYLIDATSITQLTQDHSLVAERVRGGEMTAEDARRSASRHIITRSVASEETVDVDTFGPFPLEVDHRLLLCSDGLHDVLPEAEIASIVRTLAPADAAVDLVRAANAAGGPDNVSAVIYRASGQGRSR